MTCPVVSTLSNAVYSVDGSVLTGADCTWAIGVGRAEEVSEVNHWIPFGAGMGMGFLWFGFGWCFRLAKKVPEF